MRPRAPKVEADQPDQRQYPQRVAGLGETEKGDHEQDRRAREEGLGRGPYELAEKDVVEFDRRVEDRVPGFLHMHAREARVQALERGAVHRRVAHHARSQERDVGHAGDFGNEHADAEAQAEEVDHRVGEIAQHGRQGELAPHQKVALPYRHETQRQPWGTPVGGQHGVQSRSSRPVSLRKTSSRFAGRCR